MQLTVAGEMIATLTIQSMHGNGSRGTRAPLWTLNCCTIPIPTTDDGPWYRLKRSQIIDNTFPANCCPQLVKMCTQMLCLTQTKTKKYQKSDLEDTTQHARPRVFILSLTWCWRTVGHHGNDSGNDLQNIFNSPGTWCIHSTPLKRNTSISTVCMECWCALVVLALWQEIENLPWKRWCPQKNSENASPRTWSSQIGSPTTGRCKNKQPRHTGSPRTATPQKKTRNWKKDRFNIICAPKRKHVVDHVKWLSNARYLDVNRQKDPTEDDPEDKHFQRRSGWRWRVPSR